MELKNKEWNNTCQKQYIPVIKIREQTNKYYETT